MVNRWRALFSSLDVDDALVEAVFDDLAERYGENGRFYHNLDHIESVLDHIHPFLPQADHPIALQLSAWFHDVVYDAKCHDNEAKSALVAQEALAKMGLPEPSIHETERLIMLTVGHKTAVSDKDGQILLVADLAILASEPTEYDAYAQAIRREYAHVPDDAYRVGRTQVLKRLGERPFIYYLPEHQSWGAKAQANIQRELTMLG